jgi:DNA-binding Xre family transcriptional regulator
MANSQMVHMRLGPLLLKRLEDFRLLNRVETRTEAVRWLIQGALDKKLTPKAVGEEEGLRTMAVITPAQIRAARGLLDWSREDLIKRCGVSMRTLVSIESGKAKVKTVTLTAICEALSAAGIKFINENGGGGAGVHLKRVSDATHTRGFPCSLG